MGKEQEVASSVALDARMTAQAKTGPHAIPVRSRHAVMRFSPYCTRCIAIQAEACILNQRFLFCSAILFLAASAALLISRLRALAACTSTFGAFCVGSESALHSSLTGHCAALCAATAVL